MHDFTPVGDAALKYSVYLATQVRSEIRLVHIVSKQKEVDAAMTKLKQVINDFGVPAGIKVTPKIYVGSIFDSLAEVITKEDAQLVVMGTHGMKGTQKIFGSYAMKVITSLVVPFIVVQENTIPKKIEKIIVPIDVSKESLQIVKSAGDIAKMFNSEIIITYEKQSDVLLQTRLKNRLILVTKQYKENFIKYKFNELPTQGAYHKKVMDYSKSNQVDMIAISYFSLSIVPQFQSFAQSLITNETNLPCMIINSKEATISYF